ncbi:MAG: metallophosphatase [Prevotellaceae bacterium]|nr:metallophosphatase [Prevotella sp.]MDD7257867.1 metallophosphatase [Prevotellaceae bacterium]MDY6129722.1 metallophosphatase [Prevotella sp.]
MKRYYILGLLFVFALAVDGQDRKLVVLCTNDTHSTIYPMNPNLGDTAEADRGGFLRRLAMLKQERKAHPDLLLFDSGDFSQGSPYYNLFQGDVEVELMNRMGYDACTIGNHEFDFGLENMARIFKKMKFPVVCSNYDVRGTVLEGLVKDYVILRRNGLKIGVFGISPVLDGLVPADKYGGVKYLDAVEEANRVVSVLKAKKCDVVICISHIGWEDMGSVDDKRLVANTKGIDLVLGGHSHSCFKELRYLENAEGKTVAVDQNGKHALFVGKIVLDFKKR